MTPPAPSDPDNARPPGTPGGTAAFRHHAAELDIGRHMHVWPVGAVARAIALAAVTALIFASGPVRDWAFNLPLWMGPLRDGLFAAADAWHTWMQAIGATWPYDTIRGWLEALRFAGY
ncbi:MAG: hypothetical protein GVY28_04410 [Alphaproteobacteria bacterium]|jgi:hypothetical protein|nr:hypothetical protein [Alphaproteobacteria bacterium]